MKIAIIGSTSYQKKMKNWKWTLEQEGHTVKMPTFDSHDKNELEICFENKNNIEWAEQIHIMWDRRSTGTIFDFGMCFMAEKPVKIIYINPKSFENLFKAYEEFIQ